ncbi:hypothetical protein PMAYCL1PPCAC_09936, partial [Pristionchus mayeri]
AIISMIAILNLQQFMTVSFFSSLVVNVIVIGIECFDVFFVKYTEPRLVCLNNVDGYYGFKDNGYSFKRTINEVTPGSQAELQGLKVGDDILRVNGVDLFSIESRVVTQLMKTRKNEVEMIVRSKK